MRIFAIRTQLTAADADTSYMARYPRIVVPDYPHHVIVRGNNRRRLFSYPRDYERFLSYLSAAIDRAELALHAITMMSNHVHLVLRAPDAEAMSLGMKLVSQRYARHRNRERGASGKLFEERYYCDPITDDDALAVVTHYVDLNPLRAGIVTDSSAYRWSTFAIHAGEPDRSSIPQKLWTPSPWYLELGPTADVRATRYRERVERYALEGTRPPRTTVAEATELLSKLRDGKRFERPDGTRVCEARAPYNPAYAPSGTDKCAHTPKSPRVADSWKP